MAYYWRTWHNHWKSLTMPGKAINWSKTMFHTGWRPTSAKAENFRPQFKLQDVGSLPRRFVCQKILINMKKQFLMNAFRITIYAVKSFTFLRWLFLYFFARSPAMTASTVITLLLYIFVKTFDHPGFDTLCGKNFKGWNAWDISDASLQHKNVLLDKFCKIPDFLYFSYSVALLAAFPTSLPWNVEIEPKTFAVCNEYHMRCAYDRAKVHLTVPLTGT